MKRTAALILALALALCFTGCAANTTNPPPASTAPEVTESTPPKQEYDWGITLTLENLTQTGATIVCTQSGGEQISELNTGSYFIVEQLTESGWVEVPQQKLDGELAWTAEAWIVCLNGTTEWTVNWEWLYGELPSGHYRVGKEFMNFRGPGNYDKAMVYAEFSFGEMPISE